MPVPNLRSNKAPATTESHAWASFALLSAIWGSSFLFIRVGLDEGIAPLTMVTLRVLLAGLFLAAVMRWRGGRLPHSRDGWRRMTILAITNIVAPFALMAWGLQYIPTGMGGILNAIVPLFAIVLAAFVLHDEPVTVGRLAGLLVGFGGVILLALPSLTASAGETDALLAIAGMLAIAGASLFYAIAAVYARHRLTGRAFIKSADGSLRSPDSLEIAFGSIDIVFLVIAAMTLLFERPEGGLVALPRSPEGWFSMIWLGVLGTGLAYLLFFGLIERWGATRTTLVTYVIPVIAIVLGFTLLGERLRPVELLGAALIISGVAIVNSPHGHRPLFSRAPASS
ncbi:MAG: DMT family transporter [Chloroflexota bacterium]